MLSEPGGFSPGRPGLGSHIGAVAVYTDITERKQAEQQLERYAAELERANEEVKQFAYIVSHDLRAPLINLKGFAGELRSTLEVIDSVIDAALPHLDEKQRLDVTAALREDAPEALGFIDSSVIQMDRFISALLKLSRLGRRQLRLEPVDVEALVQATLETLAHRIEEQCMEDDPGLARLFQKRLEQAGYVVDLARDGEEGLAMYDASSYDAVAVDQAMPIYSGLEVIRNLASRGPLPPVIMITGTGSEQIAVEAMKLGAGDYIVKKITRSLDGLSALGGLCG